MRAVESLHVLEGNAPKAGSRPLRRVAEWMFRVKHLLEHGLTELLVVASA